jgi:hypothetical protein
MADLRKFPLVSKRGRFKPCIPKTSNSGNLLLFSFYCHAREGTLRFGYHSNDIIF